MKRNSGMWGIKYSRAEGFRKIIKWRAGVTRSVANPNYCYHSNVDYISAWLDVHYSTYYYTTVSFHVLMDDTSYLKLFLVSFNVVKHPQHQLVLEMTHVIVALSTCSLTRLSFIFSLLKLVKQKACHVTEKAEWAKSSILTTRSSLGICWYWRLLT